MRNMLPRGPHVARNMLPRGAPLHGAAPVVPTRERGPLDRLLPVLAPAVLVTGDVCRAGGPGGGCRHAHRPCRVLAPLLVPKPCHVVPARREPCWVAPLLARSPRATLCRLALVPHQGTANRCCAKGPRD
jgi:hypothetical protein